MRKQVEEITFTVPIYYQATKAKNVMIGMNWYRNAHYAIANKAKKHYCDTIIAIIQYNAFISGKVSVEYNIYLKRKGSDGGNVLAVISKFVLDGLVKAKVLEDDNASIVVREVGNYYFDKSNPRCEIIIKQI